MKNHLILEVGCGEVQQVEEGVGGRQPYTIAGDGGVHPMHDGCQELVLHQTLIILKGTK